MNSKTLLAAITLLTMGAASVQAQDSLKQAFRWDPVKVFTGTFQLEYEHKVADHFTLSFHGMGTYLSDGGLGSWYLNSLGREKEEEFQEANYTYVPKVLSGIGLAVQGRQYFYAHDNEPKGLYFGPTLMYRKFWLTTEKSNEYSHIQIEEKKQKKLDVFAAGFIAGAQLPIVSKSFVFDVYGGPVFRASSYGDQTGLADYNAWTALDHSGVTLTFGLSIGLVR